jgi:D-alanyl-D-alanine carboxypeptidase (penicillin-binding protein 5/6)
VASKRARRGGPLARLLLAVPALVAAAPGFAAAATSPSDPPAISAPSAIVVDARSGDVLYARRPRQRRQIASATKLMTALLVLERARLEDVFPAAAYRAAAPESKIGLRRGERMTVRDLLTALLLESANDAAVTLAEGVAGSRRRFVGEMNARAAELGLRDTGYSNAIGFDAPANHSSARDLVTLARRLLRNEFFALTVDLPSASLPSGDRPRRVRNRNRLVGSYPFVDGVKTGHTRGAGYVLVGYGGARGARVLSVVLGEPSERARDADTLGLLSFGLAHFRRVRALVRGRVLARVPIAHRDSRAPVAAARRLGVTIRRGERYRRRLRLPDELDGPLRAGEPVGTVEVVYRGRVVGRAPLVTLVPVPEAGIARRLVSGLPLTLLAALAIVCAGMLAVSRSRARRNRTARGGAR